jgi:hypothetical protein
MEGLPSLPNTVAVFDTATLLISDVLDALTYSVPQWGIFLNGFPVITSDNVTSFEYASQSRISKYPQEQGAFASYNKVSLPREPVFRFTTGGSISDRQDFINSVEAIVDDLNLYDVVTPEIVYSGYNVVRSSYPRQAEDANLITIDVHMEQVVIAGASTFSNTVDPSDQAQKNNGLVQAQPYTGPNLGPLQG